MFLDIANFTAWSSERAPSQVFRLLETLYHSFDAVGKKLGVFKVETIGDSYVAVCGLPQPRDNHAVVMAMFARQCLKRMAQLTRELEIFLGPSTGDLKARVGLHSGPVTAGVLRGEKARFQLFGDTVNTAARMESNSFPNRIMCSKETRDLLVWAGKGSWIRNRDDTIFVKGKGEMETFWVNPKRGGDTGTLSTGSAHSMSEESRTGTGNDQFRQLDKMERLVDWNVEVLVNLLDKVLEQRAITKPTPQDVSIPEQVLLNEGKCKKRTVIDELTPILQMPDFNSHVHTQRPNHKGIDTVPHRVRDQLHEFVFSIASLYRDVPFHNFEHASHVIMSAGKLMKRIVTPDGIDYELKGLDETSKELAIAKQIHEVTVRSQICKTNWVKFASFAPIDN